MSYENSMFRKHPDIYMEYYINITKGKKKHIIEINKKSKIHHSVTENKELAHYYLDGIYTFDEIYKLIDHKQHKLIDHKQHIQKK
jgi:hypothetical protein